MKKILLRNFLLRPFFTALAASGAIHLPSDEFISGCTHTTALAQEFNYVTVLTLSAGSGARPPKPGDDAASPAPG